MIGKYARYKKGRDKKEYIVIYHYPENKEKEQPEEICILVDFPYYPNRIKQLKIWQLLDKFDILDKDDD